MVADNAPDKPSNQTIILKLSGESLVGATSFGIDPSVLTRIAREIAQVKNKGVRMAIVIGGGNLFRGAQLAAVGVSRVVADQIGMLSTVINSLALEEALKKQSISSRVLSAVEITTMCDTYSTRAALQSLLMDEIVICAAGTGNPFFTTDSAASLRAIELDADLILKATKVDGVYSADPNKQKDATRFTRLNFDYVIEKKLAVMDATALVMCRDYNIPVQVFNLLQPGALVSVLAGEEVGTTIGNFDTPYI